MNYNKLRTLVITSKMDKKEIAASAKISRTTLDNAINGADIKVSTIENLASVLGVQASCFFSEENDSVQNIELYKKEIERLQSLLKKTKTSTKLVVELDITSDEFVKMGLQDKVIQVLKK